MTNHSHLLRRVILVLSLLVPLPALAAGFACAKPTDTDRKGSQDEAKEAVVKGSEVNLSGKDMQSWLKLLVGRYTYEGNVDLCGKGNARDQRPVTGKAECVASGIAPNVHCRVNVNWPAATRENGSPVLGGVSNLAPAEYVFSIEIPRGITKGAGPNGWGIVFMQLDSSGAAEWASGVLREDTFIATEPCVDIPGDCHKITQITAKPGSNEISMLVDTKINGERKLRQAFLLHREPTVRKVARATGAAP